MKSRAWLAFDRPTIGDIACYPYVVMAPQGDVPLDEYAAIRHRYCPSITRAKNFSID